MTNFNIRSLHPRTVISALLVLVYGQLYAAANVCTVTKVEFTPTPVPSLFKDWGHLYLGKYWNAPFEPPSNDYTIRIWRGPSLATAGVCVDSAAGPLRLSTVTAGGARKSTYIEAGGCAVARGNEIRLENLCAPEWVAHPIHDAQKCRNTIGKFLAKTYCGGGKVIENNNVGAFVQWKLVKSAPYSAIENRTLALALPPVGGLLGLNSTTFFQSNSPSALEVCVPTGVRIDYSMDASEPSESPNSEGEAGCFTIVAQSAIASRLTISPSPSSSGKASFRVLGLKD